MALTSPQAQEAAVGTRVRFSIGAATNEAELALVPELIKEAGDLANSCINIPVVGKENPVRIAWGQQDELAQDTPTTSRWVSDLSLHAGFGLQFGAQGCGSVCDPWA